MSDDDQLTNTSVTDPSNSGAGTSTDSTADASMDGVDPNLAIPSLDDLEYATPSAYIDPDLPEIKEEEEKEEPEEEVKEEDILKMTPEQIAEAIKASNAVMIKVAEKIANSRNILIALSSDPSVDELSAGLALALFLDRLGKHAIAIFSGTIPDALQFLNPGEVFEKNPDVLQDFVISLNKEKADHLRYKLDGDFVRVYVTPYRTHLSEANLEFSYGDYNVDLCLALNVTNAIDLDPALREYGKIMRDATVVNITTGNPGKFGEIEWTNRHSSSLSEMVSNLFLSASGDVHLNANEATVLLTGIVAATDRFARANTFAATMEVASRLLDAGADQQIVAANISEDLDNQFFTYSEATAKAKKDAAAIAANLESPSISFEPTESIKNDLSKDDSAIVISHGEEGPAPAATETVSEPAASAESSESLEPSEPTEEPAEELAEEAGSSEEPAPVGGSVNIPVPESSDLSAPAPAPAQSEPESTEGSALLDELKATEASLSGVGAEAAPEPVQSPVDIASPGSMEPIIPAEGAGDATSKYGQMLEDALNEPASAEAAPMASGLPPVDNPAASSAPVVTGAPEVGNMPEINYGENTDQLLPPPPAPPVDLTAPMPMPAASDMGAAPMPAPESTSPAPGAPDAFTIPGV
ncbi:hypothetical protein IJ076_00065 [Candidatus Saccharibacteria bacterium]|nr:hypothetical protein [Candidatus Saccharibacteria bacterium]